MLKILRVLAVVPAFSLAACAVMPPQSSVAPTMTTSTDVASLPSTPAQSTAAASAMTDISAYVDPAALKLMGEKSRIEAAGAQFNALQFGRVGAPRNWQGDSGVSGQVTVGPFVRVNLIDCRDFTHSVTIAGASYARKGTACRDTDGSWSVVDSKAG